MPSHIAATFIIVARAVGHSFGPCARLSGQRPIVCNTILWKLVHRDSLLSKFEMCSRRVPNGTVKRRPKAYEATCPRREQTMNYSRTLQDGSARDDAVERRNSAVRQALGMGSKPKPDTEQPAEQKPTEKPNE
jgi:hypothetical protein